MLLCSPNYVNQTSLPLCVPGEPESQLLAFAKETMLWASPANAGAQVLAEEIADAVAGLTISTADARPATATHMLLYLNEDSFSDARLADQVQQARKDKLKIVMAHENDPDLGGCLFSRFFEVTPQERAGVGSLCSQSQARNLPSPRPLPCRSSSPMDSTRTSRARASRGATTRRARLVYTSSCAPAALASQGVPFRRCRSRFWQRTSARLPFGRAASPA